MGVQRQCDLLGGRVGAFKSDYSEKPQYGIVA